MTQHRVIGTLTRDAQAHTCLGGAYVLDIEMQQPRETIVCSRQYGHGSSAAIAAHSAANQLRHGDRVEVLCIGFGLGFTADDKPAIALRGVDSITRLAQQTTGKAEAATATTATA